MPGFRGSDLAAVIVAIYALLLAGLVLDSAHVISPILLAWYRPELRAIVRREWVKHLLLPLAIVPACLLSPQDAVFGFYSAWNIFHFGAQNWGVWQLFGRKTTADGRVRRGLICLGATAFGMAIVPALWPGPYTFVLATIVFSINHWVVDIWLSSRASQKWWLFLFAALFLAAMYAAARQGPLSVHVLPQIVVIRWAVGFVHFIYSARIWKRDAAVALLFPPAAIPASGKYA